MTEKTKFKLGYTLQTIMLCLGLYFIGRIIRNNFYFELIAPIEKSNPALHEGLSYLGHLIFIVIILVYFYFMKEERFCLESARFTGKNKAFPLFLLGFVCGFAMNGLSILTAVLHGDMDMVGQSFDPLMLIFVFVAIFIQSSTEEFHYRVLGYNRILNKTSLGYAVIGSAIAFSMAHMLNAGISAIAMLNLALIGVLYALSMKATGNVWFACAHHAAWNFTQNCVFGLPNSGKPAVITIMAPTYTESSFFYDPDFGVEGTLMTTIINIVAIVIMALIIKNKKTQSDLACDEDKENEIKR